MRGGTYFGQMIAAEIAPGRHGFLDLATSRACDNGRRRAVRYTDLRSRLPQGGTVSAPRASISVFCGLSMSELGLPPARVHAGATLRFLVILSNPSTAEVALRRCPGYTEGVAVAPVISHRSYALNCSTIQAIPSRRSVRYAMRLAVPRRAKPGFAKLFWSLNTPTGPSPAPSCR
jgi:hypothetical protein